MSVNRNVTVPLGKLCPLVLIVSLPWKEYTDINGQIQARNQLKYLSTQKTIKGARNAGKF
jgi:hypothetical protein